MNIKWFSMIKKVLCLVVFAMLLSSPAFAVSIDGKYNTNSSDTDYDGYTTGYDVSFKVETGKDTPGAIPIGDKFYFEVVTGGQLWYSQDLDTFDLSVAFIQPTSLIDNSYGANQVGWGVNAPSEENHTLKDLTHSDDAEFLFSLGDDISFTIDYADDKVSNSADLFQATVGGDDASKVTEASSSLEYNWTLYGTTDPNENNYYLFDATEVYDEKKEIFYWTHGDNATSPLTGSDTTYDITDPLLVNWEFEVIYEFVVDLDSAFVPETLNIILVHDSPNKIDKNKVWVDIGDPMDANPVPEPATMLLLGSGLIGIAVFRRKFRKS